METLQTGIACIFGGVLGTLAGSAKTWKEEMKGILIALTYLAVYLNTI